MFIDGYEAEEYASGIFKIIVPYSIDKRDWMLEENHRGLGAIIKTDGDESKVMYVSTTPRGYVDIGPLYNTLKSSDNSLGYIEGLPAHKNYMGTIYAG